MDSAPITEILALVASGDAKAERDLLDMVYAELHHLAQRKLARERPDHTLQATALVNEAYLRLFGTTARTRFENRGHFFGAAAEAMRRILVDQARRSKAQKRGGAARRVPLTELDDVADSASTDRHTIAVSEALEELEARDPRAALVVKLRFFVGLTLAETATSLDLAPSTVSADWTVARAWLQYRLSSDAGSKSEEE